MRVFVAGAAGAIGRRLIPQLVAHGHQVTASTRGPAKLEDLRALGADPVVVDGLDAAAVGEAIAKVHPDAIVHQMTALAGKPDLRNFDEWFATTNLLRTTGTEHLLAAAQAAGVTKFVAQSYTGWSNIREGGPVKTEDDPFDPDPAKNQVESIAGLQFLDREVPAAALEGIVLRYGNFYGPGASESLVGMTRKRQLPIIGSGAGVWSWIHLDDAAAATVAALERGVAGQAYNVVDDTPATFRALVTAIARATNAPRPRVLPRWLLRLVAPYGGAILSDVSLRVSNAKAKRELGWAPRYPSIAAGVHG